MAPRRISIDIDRIVLDGVALNPADIARMRAAIAVELTNWLSDMDAEALSAGAVPRAAQPPQVVASLSDGRALGRSVARAVRDAVEPAGAPLRGARPAVESVGAPLPGAQPGIESVGPGGSR
jgi:hypothetical protein